MCKNRQPISCNCIMDGDSCSIIAGALWRQLIQQEMELTQFKIIFSELRARDNRTLGNLIEMDRLAAIEADVERERIEGATSTSEQENEYQQAGTRFPQRTMQDDREHLLRTSAGIDFTHLEQPEQGENPDCAIPAMRRRSHKKYRSRRYQASGLDEASDPEEWMSLHH